MDAATAKIIADKVNNNKQETQLKKIMDKIEASANNGEYACYFLEKEFPSSAYDILKHKGYHICYINNEYYGPDEYMVLWGPDKEF